MSVNKILGSLTKNNLIKLGYKKSDVSWIMKLRNKMLDNGELENFIKFPTEKTKDSLVKKMSHIDLQKDGHT